MALVKTPILVTAVPTLWILSYLSSVEVVRVAQQVAYGAVAQLVVWLPKTPNQPADFLDEEDTFGGYLKQGYESNGDRIKTSGAIYGLSETAVSR